MDTATLSKAATRSWPRSDRIETTPALNSHLIWSANMIPRIGISPAFVTDILLAAGRYDLSLCFAFSVGVRALFSLSATLIRQPMRGTF
ncbi:hypothetical protein FBF71_35135 [Bradyrhizobium elkanii]|nr:hypothetical protein [Bradyrhizobium elkanii]NWL73102.1 hypothetical protein [Bradyrhizobium elkanii]RYM31696.1 hypothetical protein EWH13_03215 [Bradyrhizobium elkanii]